MEKEKIKKLRLSQENLEVFNKINNRIYTFVEKNVVDYFEEKSDEVMYDADNPPILISTEWKIYDGKVLLIRSYDDDYMPVCRIPLEHLTNGLWVNDIKRYFMYYEHRSHNYETKNIVS